MSAVRPAFEIRHIVSFEDTNLVGNVYFARHLSWQGRCREMFLAEHAPDVVDALRDGLALVTLRCGCEYYAELSVLDEVAVRMRLASLVQNRIGLRFDYVRLRGGAEQLVARGHQEVACMRRDGDRLVATPIPDTLRAALRAYEQADADTPTLTP
jgi:enediyne biosynthesis thioesterase